MGANGCAYFSFEELCDRPLGAADYFGLFSKWSLFWIILLLFCSFSCSLVSLDCYFVEQIHNFSLLIEYNKLQFDLFFVYEKTEKYHTLALEGVPIFGLHNRTAAYRFVTLVDVSSRVFFFFKITYVAAFFLSILLFI